jgi:signal peptidase II
MVFVIVISVLSLDQLTKYLITKSLALGKSIPVIQGVFNLTLVHNRGAAFGILKNQLPLFIVTAAVAIALIFWSLKSNSHKKNYALSLSLILAGALGNLIDRLLYGYVIDFLDFRVWPVFNVADSAITIGAVILGICILRESTSKS